MEVTKTKARPSAYHRIADHNTLQYNFLKLAEECTELSEVCLKAVTKPTGALEGNRLTHLIEELGDVVLRMGVLKAALEGSHEDIHDNIFARISNKFATLDKFMEEHPEKQA